MQHLDISRVSRLAFFTHRSLGGGGRATDLSLDPRGGSDRRGVRRGRKLLVQGIQEGLTRGRGS